MDTVVSLYLNFDGRIGRKTFWLWTIVLGAAIFLLGLSFNAALGYVSPVIDPSATPEAISTEINSIVRKSAWVWLVLTIVFSLPALALFTKRRHDRDNNGLDAQFFLLVPVAFLVAQGLGLGFSVIGAVLGAILAIYATYLLVVLGVLRGTSGPNSYGPDPLTAGAIATT